MQVDPRKLYAVLAIRRMRVRPPSHAVRNFLWANYSMVISHNEARELWAKHGPRAKPVRALEIAIKGTPDQR